MKCGAHTEEMNADAEFGNASASEPMTFVAFYLLNGEQDLIQMLDSK